MTIWYPACTLLVYECSQYTRMLVHIIITYYTYNHAVRIILYASLCCYDRGPTIRRAIKFPFFKLANNGYTLSRFSDRSRENTDRIASQHVTVSLSWRENGEHARRIFPVVSKTRVARGYKGCKVYDLSESDYWALLGRQSTGDSKVQNISPKHVTSTFTLAFACTQGPSEYDLKIGQNMMWIIRTD